MEKSGFEGAQLELQVITDPLALSKLSPGDADFEESLSDTEGSDRRSSVSELPSFIDPRLLLYDAELSRSMSDAFTNQPSPLPRSSDTKGENSLSPTLEVEVEASTSSLDPLTRVKHSPVPVSETRERSHAMASVREDSSPQTDCRDISIDIKRINSALDKPSVPRKNVTQIPLPHNKDRAVDRLRHKMPKVVAEWINRRDKKVSVLKSKQHQNGISDPIRRKHKTIMYQPTFKLSGQLDPSSSVPSVQDAFQETYISSRAAQNDKWKNNKIGSKHDFRGLTHLNPRPSMPSFSSVDDAEFAKVFKTIIYPCIRASVDHYRSTVPKKMLFSVAKDVSTFHIEFISSGTAFTSSNLVL